MLYNDLVGYSQDGVSYIGDVVLKIQGISNSITLNNIRINFSADQNYSSTTTIAVISIDIAPSGVITIEALPSQAGAILQATKINVLSNTSVSVEY